MARFLIPSHALLNEENDGSQRVIRLVITASHPDLNKGMAEVRFNDTSFDSNTDRVSLAYTVRSDDQDWAFVTASTIDERFDKIKAGRLARSLKYISGRNGSLAITVLAMPLFLYAIWATEPNIDHYRNALDAIRAKAKDLTDFMYQVEVLNLQQRRESLTPPLTAMLLPFLLLLFAFVVEPITKNLFPYCTFYWGDAVERYNRKANTRKMVFGGVILAGLVGLGVNFLSAKLF